MYYINNYRQEAIDKIIPYLIEFPQVVKSIEMSADRYQAIEDLLWKVADNFKLTESRGIFLRAHAHNENANVIFSDRADDAFTYGTKIPEKQAYGTGHYYSQASYLSGSSKTISEDKLIRAVQAKIIENNTNATIEDLIQALKLYFNANSISIYESYPLNLSIMIKGEDLELSATGNKDIIKSFLPACVSLKSLYLNDETYNIFQFSNQTSYGDSRFPRNITENVVSYPYYSQAITLNSEYNEYIETKHTELSEGMYCCFTGELTESYSGNILLSSTNGSNSFRLNINSQLHFELLHNNTSYNTPVLAEAGKKYTFIVLNSNNQLKLWVFSGVKITGEDKDKDEAYITNQILNTQPNVTINRYSTINNAPIYINGAQNGTSVICGDFTYYAIIFGHINNINQNDIYEYYVTSYGQKQILFNCISNTNHLKIHSNDISSPIQHTELITLQSDFKYTKNHGNSKYAYFDGNSNIKYDTNKSFDRSKFTVIGSPSISDEGIASGFSNKDYLKSSKITIGDRLFRVECDFTTGETLYNGWLYNAPISTNLCLWSGHNSGHTEANVSFHFADYGFPFPEPHPIKPNSSYRTIFEKTSSSTYRLYVKDITRNIEYSSTHVKDNLSSVNNEVINIGYNTNNYDKSVNLNSFKIYVDGIEVFNGNKYLTHNNEYIDDFNLDISLCTPISLNESNVLSGFMYNENIDSEIFITDSDGLVITLPVLNTSNNIYQRLTLTTPDNILFNNIFNNISIKYNGSKIEIYNNENIIYSLTLANNLKIVYRPPVLNIGNNEFLGLIKRININYGVKQDIVSLNLPYMYTLREDTNKIPYINNNTRIITVPQLISDTTGLDLYGNQLIGIR